MSWSIQQVARMSGVTSRTLRYYDEIGLLAPAHVGTNGYRYYEHAQLMRLQQILLLREMGLDLASVGEIVNADHDPAQALHRHHAQLLSERQRLDRLAETVSATIQQIAAGEEPAPEQLFADITARRAGYLASLPKKRTAAGVLFTDARGRVLLVDPMYTPYWQLPGGVADADESPLSAATRSVRRELALPVEPRRLLVVDWVPPNPGRIEGLLFIYEGPSLSAQQIDSIVVPPMELRSWAWCTPAELPDRLPPHMLRRTEAALQASADGATHYLEDGVAA